MGNYNQFKLEVIFPKSKENYDTLEKFYAKVLFNIASAQYKEPEDDFHKTVELLYNMDEETYRTIRGLKIEYRVFRKIIPYFNGALATDSPVKNIDAIVSAYKVFNSTISNFISAVFLKYEKADMKAVADHIKESAKAVAICRSRIYSGTQQYRIDDLTNEYIESLISYSNIKREIARAVDKRINDKVVQYEQISYRITVHNIVTQQEKDRKAHRGRRS